MAGTATATATALPDFSCRVVDCHAICQKLEATQKSQRWRYKKIHLALENLCAPCVCVCECVVCAKELLLGAGGEYVTRNDELLAGDARQALMRDDSVKLDKRIWARGSWAMGTCVCLCVRACVCAYVQYVRPSGGLTLHSTTTTRLDLMKMTERHCCQACATAWACFNPCARPDAACGRCCCCCCLSQRTHEALIYYKLL